MGFATDLLSGLTGFRDHLVNTAEEAARPALAAVEAHLSRLLPLVHTNVLAAEDEARAILHELYGNLAAEVKAELAAAPAEPAPAPAPVAAQPAEPAPVAADPTPAPSTTAEASSAPSSTPSASTATDTPAPSQ